MKHLKSRVQDLRHLFETSITIEYVAEPLKAVAPDLEIAAALAWMEDHDFDVIGIERDDRITGYVERSHLQQQQSGVCGDYQQHFHHSELIAISTPLIKLMPILKQTPRVFVLDCNRVSGIVTGGDLQKAPVRMLLFSLVTLLEMHLLRLIRRYYPLNTWQGHLKPERLAAAQKLWQESQARNEATDLLDYLQFCDKRDLILQQPTLVEQLGLQSRRAGDRLLTAAEHLRNRLAHAQDLVGNASWEAVIDLAAALEALLLRCEEL